jgi:zinc transporter ZupT
LSNPIRDLQNQPWAATLRTAALVVLAAVLLEWALEFALQAMAPPANEGPMLPAWLLVLLGILAGPILGAATTELWCYQQRSRYLSPELVWTLVGSLLMVLSFRWLLGKFVFQTLLPPAILTEVSGTLAMGIAVGGFWRVWSDRLRR